MADSRWFAILTVDKRRGDLFWVRFYRTAQDFVNAANKGDIYARIEPFHHSETAAAIGLLRGMLQRGEVAVV